MTNEFKFNQDIIDKIVELKLDCSYNINKPLHEFKNLQSVTLRITNDCNTTITKHYLKELKKVKLTIQFSSKHFNLIKDLHKTIECIKYRIIWLDEKDIEAIDSWIVTNRLLVGCLTINLHDLPNPFHYILLPQRSGTYQFGSKMICNKKNQ